MNHAPHGSGTGPTQRNVELGVALATLLFGVVVIYGSSLVGVGWSSDGPQAGFFPFYVGLIIVACSAINFFQGLRENPTDLFTEWGQFGQVLKVFIPTAIYVALVPFLGIYVPSVILIAVFMKWLGSYGWPLTVAVAFGVPAFFYATLERWFLIPLPKGPVEAMLGL